MGIIKRHSNAPYASGETIDGTVDLEADVNAFVTEFNGNIEDVNIKSTGANIPPASVGTGAITSDKLLPSSVTTRALASVAGFTSEDTTDLLTTSGTLVDMPSISSITTTPAADTDIIIATFSCTIYDLSATEFNSYVFTFSVDGTDLDALFVAHIDTETKVVPVTYTWSQAAGAGTAGNPIAVVPRYLKRQGTDGHGFLGSAPTNIINKIFSVYRVAG